jgi:hypothetical protein
LEGGRIAPQPVGARSQQPRGILSRRGRAGADFRAFPVRGAGKARFWTAWNWPRISPEDSAELSAGKLGSSIGMDISKLWFVFRRPGSTPACPPAQAAKPPMPSLHQRPFDSLAFCSASSFCLLASCSS